MYGYKNSGRPLVIRIGSKKFSQNVFAQKSITFSKLNSRFIISFSLPRFLKEGNIKAN